jgi:hypothetical protein
LVRFVTVYCAAAVNPVTVFFEDGPSGAALLSVANVVTDTGATVVRYAQDCRFVFQPGQSFHFQVDVFAGGSDSADVSCSGYDLVT